MEEQKSYVVVTEELKTANQHLTRGLSVRSVRQFSQTHDIQVTSRLADHELNWVVAGSVAKVFHFLLMSL